MIYSTPNEEFAAIVMITLSNLHKSFVIESVEYGDGTYKVYARHKHIDRPVQAGVVSKLQNEIKVIKETYATMKGVNNV